MTQGVEQVNVFNYFRARYIDLGFWTYKALLPTKKAMNKKKAMNLF